MITDILKESKKLVAFLTEQTDELDTSSWGNLKCKGQSVLKITLKDFNTFTLHITDEQYTRLMNKIKEIKKNEKL